MKKSRLFTYEPFICCLLIATVSYSFSEFFGQLFFAITFLVCLPTWIIGSIIWKVAENKGLREASESKMRPCPTCSQDISKTAISCPNCGESFQSSS